MSGNIKQEIAESFKNGTTLTKLIYINLGVFLVVNLSLAILGLFEINSSWFDALMLPASVGTLIRTPWSILTYMFLHHSFIHIIFNILMLYWFGNLFLQYCSQHNLVGLYLIGGIAGGATYIAAYNFFPKFETLIHSSHLLGASAAIMAITVATAVLDPDRKVKLFFVSQISLKWLAIATVLISLLQVSAENAGGEISHIGGAVAGFVFAKRFQSGKDITAWINKAINGLVNLFKGMDGKPHMKATRTSTRESDAEYNFRKRQANDEIDRILDKIKSSGYESLNEDEKKRLFDKGK